MKPSPPQLLEDVLERIGDTSQPLAALAGAYLHRLPWDAAMTPDTAYHEVLGLFDFIEHRHGHTSVRVFNPSLEDHGYKSAGTVIEIHVDDGPFLVDSVTAELQARGLVGIRIMHPVIGTTRDESGKLLSIESAGAGGPRESVQHYVLDRLLDPVDHPDLESRLESVLGDVVAAVQDFSAMVEATGRMIELTRAGANHYPESQVDEAVAFLEWLRDDSFVFLGYREYRIVGTGDDRSLEAVPDTGLGILSDPRQSKAHEPLPLASLAPELQARYEEGDLLVISKTNRVSSVHRRAKMDYVGIRITGPRGDTVGEARMLGLFTSKAHMESVSRIPLLREKLAEIESGEDLIAGSHDHKAIVELIEGFPKDELFGLPTGDLRRVVLGLLALQERGQARLFVRRDLLDRSVRALVAMPRDRFSDDLRQRLQDLFLDRFGATSVDYHLSLGRSDVARLHFIIWIPEGQDPEVAFDQLQGEVLALTRSWSERVAEELENRHDPATAIGMVERWANRMPPYYMSSTPLNIAAGDIEHLDALALGEADSIVGLQNEVEGPDILTRVTLYSGTGKRALSELAPALEDMGLEVVEEVPTRISREEGLFLHDFGVRRVDGGLIDLETAGERVAGNLAAVWQGDSESDSLNRLVLTAGLDHHQVALLRAYQTYWRRVSPMFTIRYVNDALVAHSEIVARLVRLFEIRFDPASDGQGYEELREEVLERLDAVPSLDDDRILRGSLRLIEATVRTNAYRPDRSSLALKVRSADVPNMPSPRPHLEVFVLGEDVEGVHLRAGSRARGGLRWSERREDYRNEVLGLMKAQTTKNAIIVPTGAKGGFVLRRPPADPGATADAVYSAYQVFIRGLLDVTDNLIEGEVVHPENVRVHDGPDPYLVVAADRGTASFSDAANQIAREYGFWLDDAFASGGANGYDHKRLGVTARGAWQSLECHLLEDGIDPRTQAFTAVGIGDMSGDVFGNGMLGSETIKLVAAFDHRHIFLDPNPDPSRSFHERKRLFDVPRSSWDDYDRSLISEGGGVYSRALKKIELSEPARVALAADDVALTPAELIRVILEAPVDLLWNGGIGTYVKASDETHEFVGDRANDAVRIDASDLRARVVVEGGNLGLTQRGRIEYARRGMRINTDFIDNSAGVNCSDREVNLKILLRAAELRDEIGREESHALMAREAPNVVRSILGDSRRQALMLTRQETASADHMDAYEALTLSLEREGVLDRDLESLPSTQDISERSAAGEGLTRPELAVLSAYAKQSLAESLLSSELPDSISMLRDLIGYFPGDIAKRFEHLIWDHPLRRELIAMIVSSDIVNSMGPTFVSRLVSQSGASPAAVLWAYLAAGDLVDGAGRRQAVEDLFGVVEHPVWSAMMTANDRLTGTLTRWYLKHAASHARDTALTQAEEIRLLEEEAALRGSTGWHLDRKGRVDQLVAAGVPPVVASQTVDAAHLVHAPSILEVAQASGRSRVDVAAVFQRLGQVVLLDDLELVLVDLNLSEPWNRWAQETIEDDILAVRRSLAERVLASAEGISVDHGVEQFLAERADSVARVAEMVATLRSGAIRDTAPLLVAVRQIQNLA